MREFFSMLRARFRALLNRSRLNRDLEEEIRFHLAEKQDRLVNSGVGPAEALSAARLQFGNPSLLRESCRDAWMFRWLEITLRDSRHALRLFSKSRGFTLTALLALAFGIGAATAIFSLIHAVLLQPLPYETPRNLYTIQEFFQRGPKRFAVNVNSGNFLLWSQHCGAFSAMAALMPESDNLILPDGAVPIHGARASAALFSMLGVRPELGAFFTAKGDRAGSGISIVLTHSLWKRQFQSDPSIIGKKIVLNGYPAVVLGVLPSSFYFPKTGQLYGDPVAGWTHPIEYFTNLGLLPYETEPGMQMFNFAAIARLRPGVSSKRAAAQLNAIESQVAKNSGNAHLWAEMNSLKTAVVGPADRKLWLSMWGAVLVLTLVCINLAGLLLAKSLGRTHEVAVRDALGASRLDLFRQFMIEGLLLTTTGGVLGLFAAYWGVRAFVLAAPIEIPRLQSVSVDGSALLFSILTTIGTGVLVSLVPAICLLPSGSASALKTVGPAASPGRPISRIHQALTISEFALCTILLISALLISRSFLRVWAANERMNESHVLVLEISAPPDHYNDVTRRRNLYTKLIDDARHYPGVQMAGIASAVPLTGETWTSSVHFREYPQSASEHPFANFRFISPEYLPALGLPLVSGRYLSDSDSGRHVVVLSERLARQLPRTLNPIGIHVRWRSPIENKDTVSEIVGVVQDLRTKADEQAPFMLYIPYWEWPPWGASLVLRTSGEPGAVALGMRKVIRRVDNEIAVPRAQTMRDILSDAVAPRRFLSVLGLLFAGSATFLAALGLYGLVSLFASQRTREIGIRLAVGAPSTDIFRMLISQSLKLALIGLAIGVVCAAGVSRMLTALLYEIKPQDPSTFLLVCIGLLLVALAASYTPARRAMKIDPIAALKWE